PRARGPQPPRFSAIMTLNYVHGYDAREARRLADQAATLIDLLHGDTRFPAGSTVLEAGCGVGAQTVTLALRNPHARIIGIDVSAPSLAKARAAIVASRCTNVTFAQATIFDLPLALQSIDHAFLCFVLEHLARPVAALGALRRVLKPGGTITVIEGDHGSTYFHPDSAQARQAIHCQVALQAVAGGDALLGRRLYPLLNEAQFDSVHVSPRMVYVDASRPELADGFTRNTFIAMIEGI